MSWGLLLEYNCGKNPVLAFRLSETPLSTNILLNISRKLFRIKIKLGS